MAKSSIYIFRQPRMHQSLKLLPQKVCHLITIIERKFMGYPGKAKFPIISNHFAKCDHKGEPSAVLSAIYYLKVLLLVVCQQ